MSSWFSAAEHGFVRPPAEWHESDQTPAATPVAAGAEGYGARNLRGGPGRVSPGPAIDDGVGETFYQPAIRSVRLLWGGSSW